MWRFVLKENIAHLKLLISSLEDQSRLGLLRTELQEAEDELAELNRLSAQAHAAHDESFSALLTAILRNQVRRKASSFGLIQLLEADSSSLKIAAQVNFHTQFLRHFAEVRPGDGSVYGKALADGDGVWVEDITKADFFIPHIDISLAAAFHAVTSLPLLRPSGNTFGMLSLHYAQPQSWTEQDRLEDRRDAAAVAGSVIAIRTSI
jgi:GAF domain-containing protein